MCLAPRDRACLSRCERSFGPHKTKDVDITFLSRQKPHAQKTCSGIPNYPRIGLPIHVLADIKNLPTDRRLFSYSTVENFSRVRAEMIENKENIGSIANMRTVHTNPENVEECDAELAVAKVNTSYINEASKKCQQDDTMENTEGICKANTMPISHYKRKHDLQLRSRSSMNKRGKTLLGTYQLKKPKLDEAVPANTKEGYLYKYSEGIIGSWKPRYCVLEGRTFSYYNNLEKQKMKCALNFDVINCLVMPENCDHPKQFEYSFDMITM